MKHLVLALLAGALAITPLMGVAQDQDRNAKYQALANMADGVCQEKYDPNTGALISLMVVGTGQIHRSMSRQSAIKFAMREANRNARTELAKYFNSKVEIFENAAGEVVIKQKGSAAGDSDGASNEESSETKMDSHKSKQYSSAALSGLRLRWAGYSQNGMYVVIYSWSAKSSAAIKRAAKAMGDAARTSVNEAKALEGAHRQDPDAVYQKAEGSASGAAASSNSDANANSNANTNSNYSAGYGSNAAPVRTSAVAPTDDDDFF